VESCNFQEGVLTHPKACNNRACDGAAKPQAVEVSLEVRGAACIGNRRRREQQDAGNTNAAQ
jgi:hypothetical protein